MAASYCELSKVIFGYLIGCRAAVPLASDAISNLLDLPNLAGSRVGRGHPEPSALVSALRSCRGAP